MRANLVVRSLNGRLELELGKTVEYRDRQIVHCYVYLKYERYSIHAWGVRYPLASWMDAEGIRDLFFWDNKSHVTYHIELDQIRVLGTEGKQDQFGGTLNVPRGHWESIDHKLAVAWVPKEHRIILPPSDEPPWPLPERFVPDKPPPRPPREPRRRARSCPSPEMIQAGLFD